MSRLIRSLAAGGALSLCSLVGWVAADSPWDELPNETPKPGVFKSSAAIGRTKVGAKRTSVVRDTVPRNYYQELFAEESGEHSTARKRPGVPESAPAKVLSNRIPKQTAAAEHIRPIESASPIEKSLPEFPGDWPNSEPATVIKAEYDQDHSEPAAGRVQQVRVETRPKSPRVPVPPSRNRQTTSITPLSQSLETTPAEAAVHGGPLASAVSLEWVKKSEFNVGQECAVELVVKNTGVSPVEQVAVDAIFQSPVRLASARPQPVENRDRLSWNFDVLPPGSEQRIALKLIPGRRGDLGLQAQVRLTGSAASTFRVEEPLLKVALKGPADVMLGDAASQMVLVSNPGTGAAHDVKIAAQVTAGLEHARGGKDTIEMDIGTIMPGESRTIRLPLTGVKGGAQTVSVTASSNADVSNVATAAINVISPSLTIEADGPALRYKGRNAKFTVKVTNDGSVANNNVRVVQTVAEGFQFVSADHGGKYDPTQKTVSWFLGRLDSDQAIQVSCELTAIALGDFTQKVSVASDAGARAETTLDTQVDGAASLTMEIVDLDDPVEVGVETAYEIRVKNGGSKSATNVAVTCELPHGVHLLSAKGPTDAVAERHTLLFKPISQLAPGQESVFRVHVKGVEDGNQRVKAAVSSDSLSEPLVQEEQTKFYSDARR